MKTTLGNIATIQTGVFAQASPEGDVNYLQLKHFDEFGNISGEIFPDLDSRFVNANHFLKQGDILFAAKSSKNFASLYSLANFPAVASTSFIVIRLLDDVKNLILPEFIVWYLNLPVVLEIIKAQAKGTAMPSISKVSLANLELKIPEVSQQNLIIKISSLRNQESQLIQKIESLKNIYLQTRLKNLI